MLLAAVDGRKERTSSSEVSSFQSRFCMSARGNRSLKSPRAFTDEELLAYADERLLPERAADVERQFRSSGEFVARFLSLIQAVDHGDHTLGGMWRRGRWSCPPRGVLAAFVDERLGDGLSQYIRFHVETIGCRICGACVADLERDAAAAEAEGRVRKIFQSSAGKLRQIPRGSN